MSSSNVIGFKLWQIMPSGDITHAGDIAAQITTSGELAKLGFKYSLPYLNRPDRISFDPIAIPLSEQTFNFDLPRDGLPGFINDSLPDNWGRKLISASLGKRYASTVEIILGTAELSSIGALIITDSNAKTSIVNGGIPVETIESVLESESLDFSDFGLITKHLKLIIAGGGSPGGARPKLLVSDNGEEWLYKFGLKSDTIDMVSAEWAALEVASQAGLNVPEHEITTLADERCLRVKRFDISPAGGRYHTITLNSLLKNQATQEDPHQASYEDIAQKIRELSIEPQSDMYQLLGQIMINSELKNTDDHLRNFSMINDGRGLKLSPAYDIVPDPSIGQYHQLSLAYSESLPKLIEIEKAAKILGVSQSDTQKLKEKLTTALNNWDSILIQSGASEYDRKQLSRHSSTQFGFIVT